MQSEIMKEFLMNEQKKENKVEFIIKKRGRI